MKKYTHAFLLLLLTILIVSCSEKKNKEAIQYLDNIHTLSSNGFYEEALQKTDSIQMLFPKAFKEIKEALAFKQEIRKAMNQKQIADCDSLISVYQSKIDSLKQLFIFKKDKEYNEKGIYIPKSVNTNTLTATMLRAGVNEDGTMYIESVYIGNQLHEMIRVSTKDKQFAESLSIMDDGFNFRFSNLGKQYEVIKVTPVHDNGLAKFIYSFSSEPLTVTLKGKHTTSFPLANVQKKAITDSYQLSALILQQDSLLIAKDKAEILIKYLNSKEGKDSIE